MYNYGHRKVLRDLAHNKRSGIFKIRSIANYKIDKKIAEEIYVLSIKLSKRKIKTKFIFERSFNLEDLKKRELVAIKNI